VKAMEIPKGVDVYRLKGIVGRLFDLNPLRIKLVWETGEWDPIPGHYPEDDDSDSESEGEGLDDGGKNEDVGVETEKEESERERKGWRRREVEFEDSARQVGFWVEGQDAKVRVEMR